MIIPHRLKSLFLTLTTLIMIFSLINCHSSTVKRDKPLPCSNKSGLKLSVDPYFQKERQEKIFEIDLFSKGLLPVFVVFENKNADDGFILNSEHSKLLLVDYEKQANSPRKKVTSVEKKMQTDYNKKRKIDRKATQAMEVGKVGIVFSPLGMFVGGTAGAAVGGLLAVSELKNMSPMFEEFTSVEIKKISNNIKDKKLVEKIVYQGSSHSDFMYFDLKNKENKDKIKGLLIAIRNIRTGEIIEFTIDIKK